MKQQSGIAVLLPVYNGGKLLKDSVESVLRQTTTSFEFVICDDGSSDDSRGYLASIDDPRVVILQNERNRGLFPTLNRLLMSSHAPLIHLWSQDDVMYPECLTETLQFHSRYDELGMSWCQFDLIDRNGIISNPVWNRHTRPEWILPYELYAELSLIWGCLPYNIANVALKRIAVNRAGLFRDDLTYSGDFEYWNRIAKVAPIGRMGKRLIQLRFHPQQESANLASRVRNVSETLPISHELVRCVRSEFQEEAQKCYDWKVLPSSAIAWWLCVRRQQWQLARDCWKRLRPFGSPIKLILISLLAHLLRVVYLDKIFHRRLFLDAHYQFLASIGFNDEGIPGWQVAEQQRVATATQQRTQS